jgi:hypothetical protein
VLSELVGCVLEGQFASQEATINLDHARRLGRHPLTPYLPNTENQLRGPRRPTFTDLVSFYIRVFGSLLGPERRRMTRTFLRATETRARSAWLTDAECGKASETSGSRRTTLELC